MEIQTLKIKSSTTSTHADNKIPANIIKTSNSVVKGK